MYKVICKHCGSEKTYSTNYRIGQKIHPCFKCKSSDLSICLGEEKWVETARFDYREFTEEEKSWFESYEKVRQSGEYNMVMDVAEASKKAGLTLEQYVFVIKHYDALAAVN